MKIILKPWGAATLLAAMALLTVIAFSRHGEPSDDGQNAAAPAAASAAPGATTAATAATDPNTPETPISAPPAIIGSRDAVIYDGSVQDGWENWSWAKKVDINFPTRDEHGAAGASCIRMEPAAYDGVFLHHAAMVPTGYDRVTCYLNGGDQGGQSVRMSVKITMDDKVFYSKTLPPLPAKRWVPATIRLRDFGITGKQTMQGIMLQNGIGQPAPAFYIANVRFLRAGDSDPAGGK